MWHVKSGLCHWQNKIPIRSVRTQEIWLFCIHLNPLDLHVLIIGEICPQFIVPFRPGWISPSPAHLVISPALSWFTPFIQTPSPNPFAKSIYPLCATYVWRVWASCPALLTHSARKWGIIQPLGLRPCPSWDRASSGPWTAPPTRQAINWLEQWLRGLEYKQQQKF